MLLPEGRHRFSYEDYQAWPDDKWWEILDGRVYVTFQGADSYSLQGTKWRENCKSGHENDLAKMASTFAPAPLLLAKEQSHC